MAYREQEQGNIISVTKKQYNDLNQGLPVKGYKKSKKDILVPSFKDIYSKGEMDSKIAQIVYCTNNNGTLSISDEELKKIIQRHNDHLLLKMANMNTGETEILKLVSYGEPESQGVTEYIFSNGVSEINLTVNESGDVPVIDEFLLFGYVANVAIYASSDKSKGTIEERLTKLGFSEGSFTFIGSMSGATVVTNSIKKQGKYVIANLGVGPIDSGKIYIPSQFQPKEDTTVSAYGIDPNLKVISSAVIKTNGNIEFKGSNSNTITSAVSFVMQNVGWEIN